MNLELQQALADAIQNAEENKGEVPDWVEE